PWRLLGGDRAPAATADLDGATCSGMLGQTAVQGRAARWSRSQKAWTFSTGLATIVGAVAVGPWIAHLRSHHGHRLRDAPGERVIRRRRTSERRPQVRARAAAGRADLGDRMAAPHYRHRLPALDRVEQAGEVPGCLRGRDNAHADRISDNQISS